MGILAIVGRPNVGKSTLFNRLVGTRQAIVDETAGVTRDRHYGKGEWCGTEFSVIDTGGYTTNSEDVFEEEIKKQVMLAIDEADVILFLCEVETGITDYDSDIAKLLRGSKKPVVLAVNKVDTGEKMYGAYEFNKLGLGNPFSIAAADGSGTGDLLDKICSLFPAKAPKGIPPPIIFPKHIKSGFIPKYPFAPLAPNLNPVITSSKISKAPVFSVSSLRVLKKFSFGSTSPILAATGSTITAATSFLFIYSSNISILLYSRVIVSSVVPLVRPLLSVIPSVSNPEPALTSKESECP